MIWFGKLIEAERENEQRKEKRVKWARKFSLFSGTKKRTRRKEESRLRGKQETKRTKEKSESGGGKAMQRNEKEVGKGEE